MGSIEVPESHWSSASWQWIVEKEESGWTIKSAGSGKFIGMDTDPSNGAPVVGVDAPFYFDIKKDEHNPSVWRYVVSPTTAHSCLISLSQRFRARHEIQPWPCGPWELYAWNPGDSLGSLEGREPDVEVRWWVMPNEEILVDSNVPLQPSRCRRSYGDIVCSKKLCT